MKNIKTSHILIGLAVLIIGGFGASWFLQQSDPDVVSKNGLHWHPKLAIYVKGEKQEIPANIGIGTTHMPMHTHTEDAAEGVIHLEFSSMVRKDDLMLGQFFTNWGKDMHSFGENVHMTVNGTMNTDYEKYIMHDNDMIELHYE